MTKIEALELELKARKMVDGTGLDWTAVIRCEGLKQKHFLFDLPVGTYELALGIIEGMPVFDGDEVFCPTADAFVMQDGKRKLIAAASTEGFGDHIWMKDGGIFRTELLSWNPPKPKTVMVELLVGDAEMFERDRCKYSMLDIRVFSAIRKALEQLK